MMIRALVLVALLALPASAIISDTPDEPTFNVTVTEIPDEGLLHVHREMVGGVETLRYWGEAAGPGVFTLWLQDGLPIAWRNTAVDASGQSVERTLFGAHLIPHCGLQVGQPCGLKPTSGPAAWSVDGAWTQGAPHGDSNTEQEIGEAPLLRIIERGVSKQTLPSVPDRPQPAGMQAPQAWLFHDRDPKPAMATALSDAWTRAEDTSTWLAWWDAHPTAQTTTVTAPRNHLLHDAWPVVWTIGLQAHDGAWEVTLADGETSYGSPGMTMGLLDEYWVRPPPTVQFSRAASEAVAPTSVPSISQAQTIWQDVAQADPGLRYKSYERLATNVVAVGGDTIDFQVGGEGPRWSFVLFDDEGAVIGHAKPSARAPIPHYEQIQFAEKALQTGAIAATGIAGGVVWFLFSRLIRRDPPIRQTILQFIEQHPGASMADVARHVDKHHGLVQYHVGVLSRDGRIHVRRVGRKTMLAVPTAPSPATLSPRLRELMDALARPVTAKEVATSLGVSRSMASRLLRQAAELGYAKGNAARPQMWQRA